MKNKPYVLARLLHLALLRFALACVCLLTPRAGQAANTIFFSPTAAGVTKSVAEWGVDTALNHSDHMRHSVANMGASNIDVVRLTFNPIEPLIDNGNGTYSLNAANKSDIDFKLGLASQAGAKPLSLFPGGFGSVYNEDQWVRTIKATEEYIHSKPGYTNRPIVAIEAFNEPDFWVGEGNAAQLNSLITRLKAYPVFQNTEFVAASTLNSNNARAWYDQVPAADVGSSHLLGGSMTSYVQFMDYVRTTGKTFANPELHSLGEAIVGAEHGMTSGTWWADVQRTRGLFVKASDGKRLGYFEDLGRQSAAAVYRAPDGNIYAFAGGLERFGQATSYRFVSTDQDVYFNGIPVREYMLQTKFDEMTATNPAGDDFQNYGSWSNQGAYADVDTEPGIPGLDGYRWKIVNRQTGQALEVAGGGTGDGAIIRSAASGGGVQQKWNIERTRNGNFNVYNANSGRTAEIANGSLNNGGAVRQWGTADSQIQQWTVEDAGNGYFYLRNANSYKYLTGPAGAQAVQWDSTGSTNQQWQFVLDNPAPSTTAVAHYKFQGNATSSVGTVNGTLSGNPGFVSGRVGQALNLDGADDYVTLPSSVASSADITVAAWVRWDGGGSWQRIFDFGSGTSNYMFLTPRSGDNMMRFAITTSGGGNEQVLDTDALPIGEWVHLAVTLGGNTGVLYVNGKPRVAGQIFLNPSHLGATSNYIGKSQYADPLFDGMIDDVRIFNRALDPTQIAEIVQSGDFDRNGTVDAADLVIWRGAAGVNALGDADLDGDSDGADFLIWQRQLGQAGNGVASAFPAPEPGAQLICCALLAGGALGARRAAALSRRAAS